MKACALCSTPFEPHKSRLDQKYCSRKCNSKAHHRRNSAACGMPKGRTCRECSATDAEVYWSNTTGYCGACDRARRRRKKGMLTMRERYPGFSVPVILLDGGSDRERTVRRSPLPGKANHFRVHVAGLHYQFHNDEPAIITLPAKRWARIRT